MGAQEIARTNERMKVADLLNARDKMGLEERKLDRVEQRDLEKDDLAERKFALSEQSQLALEKDRQMQRSIDQARLGISEQMSYLSGLRTEAAVAGSDARVAELNLKLDEMKAKDEALSKGLDNMTEAEKIKYVPGYATQQIALKAKEKEEGDKKTKDAEAAYQGMVNANQLPDGKYEAGKAALEIFTSRAPETETKYGYWDGSKWTPIDLSRIVPGLNVGTLKQKATAKGYSDVNEYLELIMKLAEEKRAGGK